MCSADDLMRTAKRNMLLLRKSNSGLFLDHSVFCTRANRISRLSILKTGQSQAEFTCCILTCPVPFEEGYWPLLSGGGALPGVLCLAALIGLCLAATSPIAPL